MSFHRLVGQWLSHVLMTPDDVSELVRVAVRICISGKLAFMDGGSFVKRLEMGLEILSLDRQKRKS